MEGPALSARSDLRIEAVAWAERSEILRAIREAVFVIEQGVPAALEQDERDPHCQHLLALSAGTAVGTGRIDLARAGKIGRVAVLPAHRHQGIGAALMRSLVVLARDQGLPEVWFHAQLPALPFYERLGFRAVGEPFVEAGLVHRKMVGSTGCRSRSSVRAGDGGFSVSDGVGHEP